MENSTDVNAICKFCKTVIFSYPKLYKYNHYDDYIMRPTFRSSYMEILNKIKYADQLIQDILLMIKANYKFWQYQFLFITMKNPKILNY